MIKAIAIDDELLALKVIENFCGKVDFIDLEKTFHKPKEALKFLEEYPVDLLFLDINMPSMTGIELFKSINQNTMVIFTTAYSEYAVEGFNLNAIDYLLKPFTYERFLQGVNKANEYYKSQQPRDTENTSYLYIRADYRLHKIALNEILFIEGLDDYLKIHIEKSKPIVARMTMKTMLEKLPSQEFMRVHRSYIVPFRKIENVRNKILTIAEEEIPIGISYEKVFFENFGK
ncbi:LytR/AlgR family response regulator transcription factor [Emticicia sp. SJ17W-69]|uniref:LytR/AlgR family response regulator transcription factor n=1 Tax=Emticicia sp. SJ17W-69 TaxID=3421657 RepID=UPI003EBD35B7